MTYIVKATRVADAGKTIHIRETQDRGTVSEALVKTVKQHTSSYNSVKSERTKEPIMSSVGGTKTEMIEGAIYALTVTFFGTEQDVLHPGLSLGELKNISSYIVMPEDSASFYNSIVTHSGYNLTNPEIPDNPSGTISLTDFKTMVSTSKLFPDLKHIVNNGQVKNTTIQNYIKATWIPANLPNDVASIDQNKIFIL
jgi:hypothetical protein|tara:strand:- start:597 stop:1187 length:591 start_codon:yes stop_codon:yes gene_type:complete